MKNVLLVALPFIVLSFAYGQDKNIPAITQILDNQVTSWNQGNLDAFMAGYWNNDSLLFIGKSGPSYGYSNALKNYKKNYPDKAHMGNFTSTVIEIKRLSETYYFVTGKWYLKRPVGDASGVYTLLLKLIDGEWKIIVDHSS